MRTLVILSLSVLSLSAFANKAKLGKNIQGQLKSDSIAKTGQVKVNELDEETQKLFEEYRFTLKKIDSTKIYNKQLVKLIGSQKEEMTSIAKQIDSIKYTNKEIVPLMLSMVKTLDKIVSLDTPFLKEERISRVDGLKKMMNRADVSTSEKYRRILEAYQVENEYGRTIEAYRGKIDRESKELTVDFLRVGRLLLIYQTLDGKQQGIWDNESKAWLSLDSDFKRSIRDGLRIARKQAAPNILKLPVFKAKEVKEAL